MTESNQKKGLRKQYESFFAPWGRALAKTSITPNMISVSSVAVSVLSCIIYASGPEIGLSLGLLGGTLLLGFSSLLDMMDGSLARHQCIKWGFGIGATSEHMSSGYTESEFCSK